MLSVNFPATTRLCCSGSFRANLRVRFPRAHFASIRIVVRTQQHMCAFARRILLHVVASLPRFSRRFTKQVRVASYYTVSAGINALVGHGEVKQYGLSGRDN